MPEWFSGFVNTNGLRMHYFRTGGDKPPLVLAHGATDSGLCWSRVARSLESDYDVILPDARGHGAGHNIRREQFDAFVGEVREFLVAARAPLPQASSA